VVGVAAGATGPRLEVQVGGLSGTFPVAKPVMTIGRRDPTTSVFPDLDLSADDCVSRRHAEVRLRDAAVYVVDLGSTNGTILNGQPLPPQEERRLSDGDVIRLGERCLLTVRM
jgi:pSer/pThr/pTyr-binding forkhead associated (FHA) protein